MTKYASRHIYTFQVGVLRERSVLASNPVIRCRAPRSTFTRSQRGHRAARRK